MSPIRTIVFLVLVLFLASCSQPTPLAPNPEVETEAWFTDEDLDRAVLDVMVPKAVVAKESLEIGAVTNHAPLEVSPRATSDFEAQAVLNGTSGYVYFIQKTNNLQGTLYQIIRQDQVTGTNLVFAQFQNREVISVAGTADGKTVLASVKDTMSVNSDFEVFKFVRSGAALIATKLTNNSNINEKAVTISADGLRLVWEGISPFSNKAAIFIRTLNPNGTTQSEIFLVSNNLQLEPTMSANGKFVVFREYEFSSATRLIKRHDVAANVTTTIVSSSTVSFYDPSITDDGTKIAYLEFPGTIRLISGGTNQIILSEAGLSHPHITKDGKFLTFTRTSNGVQNVFTRHLATNTEAQTSTVTSNSAFGSYWQLGLFSERKIVAPDFNVGDTFSVVALEGDTLVVGAPLQDNANGVEAGAIYIFQRNQGGTDNWGEVRKHIASNGGNVKFFGRSVAIDGDTIVAGNPVGRSAHIFQKDLGGTNAWGELKTITASDEAGPNGFGVDVAIDGDTIAVGAPVDSNANGDRAVYIFERNQGGNNNWGEVRKQIASDGFFGQVSHFSLDLEGDLLVVGTSISNTAHRDAAYFFERNAGGTNNWGEIKKFEMANLDAVLSDVAVSGQRVLVADSQDNRIGAVYVFEQNVGGANNWGLLTKLTSSELQTTSSFQRFFFGVTVGASGNTIAVGATLDEIAGGAVYLYEPTNQ